MERHKFNYVFFGTRITWMMMVRRIRWHWWSFLLEVPVFLIFLPLTILGDLLDLPDAIKHRPLKK